MEIPGMLISWMGDVIANLPASLFDPKYRGPIFAILILVVLYSIVSSLNRMKRNIASVSSELSTIRSTLMKIERSLDRLEANRPPGVKEDKPLKELVFRLDHEFSERDR
jgi:hypothetical protein